MSQIITVTFAEGQREAIAAQPLEQWAYGQTLQFEGLDLPQAYRVDFSNFEYCGASIPRVGGPDGVAVPVEVLTSGRNVYAFIWVQDETSGARYRRATVRVVPGPEPDTDESPEEQSAVTEAINALNAAAAEIPERVNAAVEEAVSSGTFADVFWITQGVTTADEIYAANAAGKVCLMKPELGGLGPGVLYYLTWCGLMRILGPSGEGLEKRAVLTAWDGAEMTTIDILHETWSSPSTVKFARTASPTFTGSPKAPTAEAGTNSTQIATTAFVAAAIQAALEGFTPGQTISEELKQALLQLARKVAYIDDQGETYYQDLYDALYPPAVLASIQAAFAQGSTVIYNTDSLNVLKPLLTVTAVYDDGSTETVPADDYTLSGTLATGVSTITASYQDKTATFQVTVTAAPMAFPVTNNLTGCSTSNSAAATIENEPYSAVITPAAGYTLAGASVVITMAGSDITASAYSGGVINIARVTGALVISIVAQQIVLSSISAAYTQSGVVYNTDTLDSLKDDLVVTAAYSDGTSTVLAADAYTLSGTLIAGTSTITVSYQGKSTSFQVQVTAAPEVYLVTNELSGCTTDNSAASVVEGSAYAARITASTGYTLVGAVVTITMGGQDITASAYSGGVISIPAVTGALVISVAAVAVVLSSISAAYTQSGAVYDTDTLDSLKDDLVVTAHYSDSSTATVAAADYTLSGTLAEGTSTITVSYSGKTTTFSVTVSVPTFPAGYEAVEYIFNPNGGVSGPVVDTGVKLSGNGDTVIDVSFMAYGSETTPYVIGCLNSASANTIGLGISLQDSYSSIIVFPGTVVGINPTTVKGVRHNITATVTSSGASITDGTLSNSGSFTPRDHNVANLYLFGIKGATANTVWYPFTGRIYSVKVTEGGVIKLDLKPCVRLSDGMAGFWDFANSNFVYASELVAAPSEHNTTAEIEFPRNIMVWSNGQPVPTASSANNGTTKQYSINPTTSLYPAGILPYKYHSGSSGNMSEANIVIYDSEDNAINHVSVQANNPTRWAQLYNSTWSEFSKEWTVAEYTRISFDVSMEYLHDSYMYDKTTGQVFFAGRNTPYYGMSNISEAGGE